MRVLDLTPIMDMAYAAKYELSQLAIRNNKPLQVVLHWTAGSYHSYFNDYHINIDGEGLYHVSVDSFTKKLSHNYYKNSASIGVAVCCCYDANSNSIGSCPPTEAQIEALAKVVAVLSEALGTEIDIHHFPTHGESADNEDYEVWYPDYTGYRNNTYGPKSNCSRWDLEFLGNSESPVFDPYNETTRGGVVIREKAKRYRMSFYGH